LRSTIFAEQVIDRQGLRGAKRGKSAVVPTKSILAAANVPIIGGHHVLALQGPPEGWQATSLLERCREHPRPCDQVPANVSWDLPVVHFPS